MAGWDLHPLEKRRLSTAHTRGGDTKDFRVGIAEVCDKVEIEFVIFIR